MWLCCLEKPLLSKVLFSALLGELLTKCKKIVSQVVKPDVRKPPQPSND